MNISILINRYGKELNFINKYEFVIKLVRIKPFVSSRVI